MTRPAIGFIGLGLMGAAMVDCLQTKGYRLTVLGHRNRTGIDAALARGATEAADAKSLAEASDIVMLCMGTSAQVEARMHGPDGVIAGLAPGKVVIDFGTSLPGSTRELGAEVSERGAVMLDAPLGRTPAHAKTGQLNIMAAGPKDSFDAVKPVLDDLGENVFHLGPLGTGHTIKLINNFYGLTMAAAMSEAFAMADVAGIPREKLYGAMSAGPLHSGMMDFVKAYAIDGDPDRLAFSIRNALKDTGYYTQMVRDFGRETVMGGCVTAAMDRAVSDDRGDDTVPQLVDSFTRWFAD